MDYSGGLIMEIIENKIYASEGKEIYNLSKDYIYGNIIILGKESSPDEWGERDITILEEEEEKEDRE